jgi:hypothetical protein
MFQASVVNPTKTFLSAALNKLSSSRYDCWIEKDESLSLQLNPLDCGLKEFPLYKNSINVSNIGDRVEMGISPKGSFSPSRRCWILYSSSEVYVNDSS